MGSTARLVSKMGARRDPIYSPVEKMEEENSNTTSQKKKEGQRKRINLMIGLVCGLALFAGVAILSKRPTKGDRTLSREGERSARSMSQLVSQHSQDRYDYDDQDACYGAGCPEELCIKLEDDTCDNNCQEALETCMGNEQLSGTSPATPHQTTQQDEATLQEEIEKVTLAKFSQFDNRTQRQLKRSQAAPVEFNTNERENFPLIERCLRLINRPSSHFFAPKP